MKASRWEEAAVPHFLPVTAAATIRSALDNFDGKLTVSWGSTSDSELR
jgi:hypothetical protein